MEWLCDFLFPTGKDAFLLGGCVLEYFVLFAICVVWKPKGRLGWIEGAEIINVGQSVQLKGKVHFCPFLKHLKWQKYRNGEYKDINIHKRKYQGSTNDLQTPILEIHDLDDEDEVEYRLEIVTKTFTAYSNVFGLKLLRDPEKPRIKIFSDQMENKYFLGEDVTIKAVFEHAFSILCVTWQIETPTGFQAIDTTQSKYKGTKATTKETILHVKNCLDKETYFLLAACSDGYEIRSNKICLNVMKGPPRVYLTSKPEMREIIQDMSGGCYVTKVKYNECVEFKASIRCCPEYSRIAWIKDFQHINLKLAKYKGSLIDGDCPVLRIEKATKEDEGTYRIEAHNDLGLGRSKLVRLEVIGDITNVLLKISKQSQPSTYGNTVILEAVIKSTHTPTNIQWERNGNKLDLQGMKFCANNTDMFNPTLTIKFIEFSDEGEYSIIVKNVVGSAKAQIEINVEAKQMLFISGPVVVSPSEKIQLKASVPKNSFDLQAKLIRINDDKATQINFGDDGVCTSKSTSGSVPQVLCIEIAKAKDNVGVYQLCWSNMKSNRLNVIVDDSDEFLPAKEQNVFRMFELQEVSRRALAKQLDKMPDSFQVKWQRLLTYCNNENICQSMIPVKNPSSSDVLDITLMYVMFRFSLNMPAPTNGWGQAPGGNFKNTADDIERIRLHSNKICQRDSLEITIEDFNDSSLDLIEAIRRISADDTQLLANICKKMTTVFYRENNHKELIEKFRKNTAKSEDFLRELEDVLITGPNSVNKTQTVHLEGHVQFQTSMRYLKWQKYHNGEYVDLDIHKQKYAGSSNDLQNPKLQIHDVDVEDEVNYRLKVQLTKSTVYSNVCSFKVMHIAERPRIEIFTSQYYVGEDATITAHLTNPLEILCSTWQIVATNGTQALDMTLPKYSETKDSDSEKILRIKNCSEEDTGIYFLLAACFDGTEISSNKTEMKIVTGCPTVMLTTNPQSREKFQHGYECDDPIHITSVIYHGCVEFKAKIRSFPKQSHLVWMKGSSNIDLSDPKYKGSSIYGDTPVLRINMVTNDDKDIYRLEARNDCGKGTSNSVALEIYGASDYRRPPVRISELTLQFNSCMDEIYQESSYHSIAVELLDKIEVKRFIDEIQSLSTQVQIDPSSIVLDYGNMLVWEVEVMFEKDELRVVEKDSSSAEFFFNPESLESCKPRIIFVKSNCIPVVEAKHTVYRKYKKVLCNLDDIIIHHEYDDNDVVSKLAVFNNVSSFCGRVESMTVNNQWDMLSTIVLDAASHIFSKAKQFQICSDVCNQSKQTTLETSDLECRYYEFSNKQTRQKAIEDTIQITCESMGYEISKRVRKHNISIFSTKIHRRLPDETYKNISMEAMKDCIPDDICGSERQPSLHFDSNPKEWNLGVPETIFRLLSENKEKIVHNIIELCRQIEEDLQNVCTKLDNFRRLCQPTSLEELVEEWENREILKASGQLERFKSVVKYIIGRKENKPCVKAFLRYDDANAKDFFKTQMEKKFQNTLYEFVNIKEKSDEVRKDLNNIKEIERTASKIPTATKSVLNGIINTEGGKICAKYSNIVRIGVSNVLQNHQNLNVTVTPCIVLYCLDKTLIPFGEKPLPSYIHDYPCDIREDIVVFKSCLNCTSLNPGCDIGSNYFAGSAGFFLNSPFEGFLTAAHVATENVGNVYKSTSNDFDNTNGQQEKIMHPSKFGTEVGQVENCILGNYCSYGTDVAIVRMSPIAKPNREQIQISIADENSLSYDGSLKVIKRGQATGETTGALVQQNEFVRIHSNTLPHHECFYCFQNCYVIEDDENSEPFFAEGDSGSGVFILDKPESDRSMKPLGIAFARGDLSNDTFVCKIKHIAETFHMSIYPGTFQNEQPMDYN